MDKMVAPTAHATDEPCCQGHGEERDGGNDVLVGEEVEALRDGVVGNHRLEKGGFMNPTLSKLVASHLHPYAVDGVFGNDFELSHHKWVVAIDHKGVGSLGDYEQVHGALLL